MSQQKELILCQLANLINSMCYYQIPAKVWDRTPYPEELQEPIDALRETGEVEYSPRGGSEHEQCPKEVVIPGALLRKAAGLVCDLENLYD
jgi:hypothetical protein